MPRKSTPQEKKRKSLERDGRNCYGENDKSSRKSIRRRKEIVNRTFRRAVKGKLSELNGEPDTIDEGVTQVGRNDWKKSPDTALGEQLRHKWLMQIIRRISAAADGRERLLDRVESGLFHTGTRPRAVQEIMQHLRTIGRAHWSVSRFNIDYPTAKAIVDILNRGRR